MKIFKKTVCLLLLIAAVVAIQTGCKKNNDNASVIPTRLLVLNVSPDAPPLDIKLDNKVIVSGLTYGKNTGYLSIAPGTFHMQISFAGSADTLLDGIVNFQQGKVYSMLAVDSLKRLNFSLLADDLTVVDTSAAIRFFPLSPNAPKVDLAIKDSISVLYSNRTFNDISANLNYTRFKPISSGTYNLDVRYADTSLVLLPIKNVKLETGKLYTIYMRGLVNGSGSLALDSGIIIHN